MESKDEPAGPLIIIRRDPGFSVYLCVALASSLALHLALAGAFLWGPAAATGPGGKDSAPYHVVLMPLERVDEPWAGLKAGAETAAPVETAPLSPGRRYPGRRHHS